MTESNLEQAEKIVSNIVEKAEQVLTQCEAQLKIETKDVPEIIKPGVLKVIVFEGSNLMDTDYLGKSDPFVKIKFQNQEFKSKTLMNTLNPEWNFTANIEITSNENSNLTFEIYDEDKLKKSDFLGSYTMSLVKAIEVTDQEAVWHELDQGRGGKILFSVIYLPTDDNVEKSGKICERTESKNLDKNSSNVNDEGLMSNSSLPDEEDFTNTEIKDLEATAIEDNKKSSLVVNDINAQADSPGDKILSDSNKSSIVPENINVPSEDTTLKQSADVKCEKDNNEIDNLDTSKVSSKLDDSSSIEPQMTEEKEVEKSNTEQMTSEIDGNVSIEKEGSSIKTNDEDEVTDKDAVKTEASDVVEDQDSSSKPQSKGFISSFFGTVGGYFYGSKKTEDSNAEKTSVAEHVPREFQMQPQEANISSSNDGKKQTIDLKNESEIILEESEDIQNSENDMELNTIDESPEINEGQESQLDSKEESHKKDEAKQLEDIETIASEEKNEPKNISNDNLNTSDLSATNTEFKESESNDIPMPVSEDKEIKVDTKPSEKDETPNQSFIEGKEDKESNFQKDDNKTEYT